MKNLQTLVLLLVLGSCIKDKPAPGAISHVTINEGKKVYIINEGNFGTGNSSVSLYDSGSGQVIEDFYKSQNNEGAGDVLQSLKVAERKLFLVVNNSGKLIVCDQYLKKLKEIRGLLSPRHFLSVDHTRAYVTDMQSNAVKIIDLNTLQAAGEIPLRGWTEQMCNFQNRVFVTNVSSGYLSVINSETDLITDSIMVGYNANGCVIDKNKKLWVLTGGDMINNRPATLARYDVMDLREELKIELGSGLAGSLQMNNSRSELYFIQTDVYRMNVEATSDSREKAVPANGRNFYGLGIHPDTDDIYVSDVLDYSQRSNIHVYTREGEEKAKFKAGINSNGFYFE